MSKSNNYEVSNLTKEDFSKYECNPFISKNSEKTSTNYNNFENKFYNNQKIYNNIEFSNIYNKNNINNNHQHISNFKKIKNNSNINNNPNYPNLKLEEKNINEIIQIKKFKDYFDGNLLNEKEEITNLNLKYYNRKIRKWSEDEDRLLTELIKQLGIKNFKKISENISGRSPIQCFNRWTKILQPGLIKGPWTSGEDYKLLEWIKKEGPTKWTQCADFIKARSGKQCRERWSHTLNPKVVKGNWTLEEDFKIFFLFKTIGGKWAKIALLLPGRTENSIKNRFYSTLRKKAAEDFKNSKTRIKIIHNNESEKSKNNSDLFLDYDSVNKINKKNNSNLNLKELLKYLESATFGVMIKFKKEKSFTLDQVKEYENEILINFKNKENSKNDYSLNNNILKIENEKKNVTRNNMNLNTLHNNFTEENEFRELSHNSGREVFHNFTLNNFNHIKNKKLIHSENSQNSDKINYFDKYKNNDLLSLEKNINKICDSPSIFYSESNFNFIDNNVENFIEDLFIKNKVIIKKKENDNYNICNENSKNLKMENIISNNYSIMFENFDNKECDNKRDNFIEEEQKIRDINYFENNNNNNNNLENFIDNKHLNSEMSKKERLFSLISELENLENLVKNTKKKLMNYNINDLKDDKIENENINNQNLNIISLFKKS